MFGSCQQSRYAWNESIPIIVDVDATGLRNDTTTCITFQIIFGKLQKINLSFTILLPVNCNTTILQH